MGYTKDDDFYTRGVGAIAARDRSRVRQVATKIRRAELARKDAQMSRLAQLAGMGMVKAEKPLGDVQSTTNTYGPKLNYGGNVEGEQTTYSGSGMTLPIQGSGGVLPIKTAIIDPSRMGSAVTYQPQPKTLGGKPAPGPTPSVGPDDPAGDVMTGVQPSVNGNTGIVPPSVTAIASGIAGWSTQKKVMVGAAVAGGLYLLLRGKK